MTKKILPIVMAVLMLLTHPVYAAQHPDAEQDNDAVIELRLEDFEVLDEDELACLEQGSLSDSNDPPRIGGYWLNAVGYASTNLTLPFSIPSTTQVSVLVTLMYMDGTTGTLYCQFAQYGGNVPVDGVTRFLGQNVYMLPGTYAFRLTGITKVMYYNVKIYTP